MPLKMSTRLLQPICPLSRNFFFSQILPSIFPLLLLLRFVADKLHPPAGSSKSARGFVDDRQRNVNETNSFPLQYHFVHVVSPDHGEITRSRQFFIRDKSAGSQPRCESSRVAERHVRVVARKFQVSNRIEFQNNDEGRN